MVLDELAIAALKIRVSGVQFPPWPLTPTITDDFHHTSLADFAKLFFWSSLTRTSVRK